MQIDAKLQPAFHSGAPERLRNQRPQSSGSGSTGGLGEEGGSEAGTEVGASYPLPPPLPLSPHPHTHTTLGEDGGWFSAEGNTEASAWEHHTVKCGNILSVIMCLY